MDKELGQDMARAAGLVLTEYDRLQDTVQDAAERYWLRAGFLRGVAVAFGLEEAELRRMVNSQRDE